MGRLKGLLANLLPFAFLVVAASQRLASPDGSCQEGWVCKSKTHCQPFLQLLDNLDLLKSTDAAEYKKQLLMLKESVCNKAERGVCCKESTELVNGNVVGSVTEMPFIVRLTVKTGPASRVICGASLIASQFLLTAKHCLETFWEECIDELDCVAHFRDLVPGCANHEKGEFVIPIVRIFPKEGASDLSRLEKLSDIPYSFRSFLLLSTLDIFETNKTSVDLLAV